MNRGDGNGPTLRTGWCAAIERSALRSDPFAPLLFACIAVHAVIIIAKPQNYVADDALFYFQIAYNVAHGYGLTFSGLTPTNGFHPFWLLLCIPFGWCSSSKESMFDAIVVSIALLNTASLVAIRGLLQRARLPHPSACVLFAAPYLFFTAIGMEGHLSVLLLAATMRSALRFAREIRIANLFRVATLCGLLVFSRLDLAILIAPLTAWTALRYLRSESKPSSLGSVAIAAMLGAVPATAFLLLNALQFGTPVPISGLLKLKGADVGSLSLNGIAIVYLTVSIAGAIVAMRRPRDEFGRIHIQLTVGMTLFLLYLLFGTSEAYTWYFYSWAVLAMSGIALVLQGFGAPRGARAASTPALRSSILALAVAAVGVASMVRYGDHPDQAPPFVHREDSLARRAAQASIRRVFTFDRPGELAFYDDLSVLAADGLTTNAAFQRELADRGIAWALRQFQIQAIIVPRLGGRYSEDLCGRTYLGSLRFVCDAAEPRQISRIEAISRWNGAPLGAVDLADRPRLSTSPAEDLVTVLLERDGP